MSRAVDGVGADQVSDEAGREIHRKRGDRLGFAMAWKIWDQEVVRAGEVRDNEIPVEAGCQGAVYQHDGGVACLIIRGVVQLGVSVIVNRGRH